MVIATFSTLVQQAVQKVLGANVAMTKLGCGCDCQFDDALGARGQTLRCRRVGCAEADQLLNLLFNFFRGHTGLGQHFGSHAAAFQYKAVEQMLGTDVVMTHASGGFLRKLERRRCTVGEAVVIKHIDTLLSGEKT